MYGFWDRKQEDKSGLVSRIDGLAKIAGFVGLAVAARPFWSRVAGSVATNVAKRLPARLSSDSVKSAVQDLFSEQANSFFEFPEQVRKFVTTSISHQYRINKFYDSLANQVTEETREAFLGAKDELLPKLAAFGKVGDIGESEVEKVILNPRAIKYLTRELHTRGIAFNKEFYGNEKRVFESILSQTTSFKPDQKTIDEYFSNTHNRDSLFSAFEHLFNQQTRRAETIKKVVQLPSHIKEITIDDLQQRGHVANAVEEYLHRVGVGKGTLDKEAMPMVTEILSNLEEGFFGKKNGIFIPPKTTHGRTGATKEFKTLQEAVKKMAGKTSTGLALDAHTGQVFSLNQLKTERKLWTDTLLDELQIPLVPYKFNVPMKMFRFMQPDDRPIKYLGSLGAEPEIRRELSSKGMKSTVINALRGLGVDDRLLTVSQGVFDAEGNMVSPGTIDFMNLGNKRLVSYAKRKNANIQRLASARDQEIGSFTNNAFNFRGAEDNYSSFQEKVFANLPKFTELSYIRDDAKGLHGFKVSVSKDAKWGKLGEYFAPTLRNLYGDGTVPVDMLHPTQLSNFIDSLGEEAVKTIHEDDFRFAQNYILKESKNDRKDISHLLKAIGNSFQTESVVFDKSPFEKYVIDLLNNADNPKKIYDIIGKSEIGAQTLDPTTLSKEAAPEFYRAIMVLKQDANALYETSVGRSGIANKNISDFIGQRGIGQAYERFQEGLLSEAIRTMQIGVLDQEANSVSKLTINEELDSIKQLVEGGATSLLNNGQEFGVNNRLKLLGFLDENSNIIGDLNPFIQELFSGGTKVNRQQLGKLASASMTKEERTQILNLADDFVTKAKIVNDSAKALDAFESLKTNGSSQAARHAGLLYEMTQDMNITESLKTRFRGSRIWHPETPDLAPTNINNFWSTFSDAPSFEDWMEQPVASLKKQIQRGFGLPEYLQGLVDPNKAIGPFGAATQMMVTMPQNIANGIGLGLPGQDRITAMRTFLGFYGKRVLPLIVGYEAYKNYNANMHSIGLPGLDDMGANLIANVNLNIAGFKDALGITSVSQQLVGLLPGLDQYFTPRSREEYQEYLKYGDEEVRESRGWMIGTRSPLMGGAIKYARPNFYRRWKSHWTEADNVEISNPKYSFLPNLQNPFAPLSLLINPDWWVKKHRSDRPYLPGGVGTFSPTDGMAGNSFLTINSMGSYGPLAIGEIGGGYPTAMTGGGGDVSIDRSSHALFTGQQGSGGYGVGSGGSGGGYGRGGYLQAAGDPIRIGLHKGLSLQEIQGWSLPGLVQQAIGAVRTQAGLYGAVMQRMPFFPMENLGFSFQDPGAARSFSRTAWMGEYGEATLGIGEFFRRFISPDTQSYDAYNPLPNNMPSWLPDKFKTGDPYMRTPGIGELQLPGDAYERTHPWVVPLRVRGSAIGLSEKELIQKWLNPTEEIEGDGAEDIVDFGSAVHLQVQRQLKEMGLLVGAEVSIYNKQNNITGTVDAVVRGANGMEIIEIKTQGQKSWGQTPEKYKDQLTFYMATMGIDKGNLVFINRDDPNQVRVEPLAFDPARWQNILDRIGRARDTMSGLVDKGLASPFEAYDLVSRIEILAKVAPDSPEFRDHVEFALKGGLGGFEKQRVKQAVAQAERLKQDYRLYPKRFGVDLKTASLNVLGIGSAGEIITEEGTVKLAGLEFDPQAFSFEDPETLLAKYGIEPGKRLKVKMMEGALNFETMNDITTPVIVGNVNENLVKAGYANWDESTNREPVASQARYGNSFLGGLWENLVHSDNMLTNKFMRVRTALEQFERGEVYGTDRTKWDDPINTFIIPTINSFIRKNPIIAGIQMGIAVGTFAKSNASFSRIPYFRTKLMAGGAALGAIAATVRQVYETATGSEWTPSRYRRQGAFDEYWDTLAYLKYTAIAEGAKKQAARQEGTDIDKLKQGDREVVGLGPYAVIAIDAERRAKRTMYGLEVSTSSLQDALSAIPKRQQQIAEEIITAGSLEEKQRFYDLLPDAQRRVLGKFLGVNENQLPERQNLTKYFEKHFLPNVDWAGWDREIDLGDIKTRSADTEGMQVDKPNRAKVSKARAHTRRVPLPRMDNPTLGNIRRQINNLLATGGHSNISVTMRMMPADSSVVNVDMELFDDQTDELLKHMEI